MGSKYKDRSITTPNPCLCMRHGKRRMMQSTICRPPQLVRIATLCNLSKTLSTMTEAGNGEAADGRQMRWMTWLRREEIQMTTRTSSNRSIADGTGGAGQGSPQTRNCTSWRDSKRFRI
uniref:Uncharacterized protein n=1 Tax=Salix viminalis TaxID=40686 RepID=A0A6N2KAI6_SALVM